MSAKTTELKPCPFCGSGNVRYKEAEHAVVCARCKAFNSVTILCDSGAYLDHVERACCERYDNFVAIDVRGTRWCRFEQKPPKAEDGDES